MIKNLKCIICFTLKLTGLLHPKPSLMLYKLEIQGIVFLVDPNTTEAYTYDLTNPTKIGHVIWTDATEAPKITLLADWSEILQTKLTSNPTQTQ